MSLKKWIKLSEKVQFQNDHWTYKKDTFKLENDNREGEYHYVHTPGSSLIIPKKGNKYLFVEQFRYLNQETSLEFPCGSILENSTPLENAHKELREETGFDSNEIIYVGKFAPYSGVSDETCSVFFCEDLFPSPLVMDKFEEFNLIELTYDEIEQKIAKNEIWDGMTLAAWILFKKIYLSE
ncbi:MAG: NUDIX hydrolase [Melioribacteraceae bacterium]|nr:NUDIX hydrolase [Melioribacteraceae bacterium]